MVRSPLCPLPPNRGRRRTCLSSQSDSSPSPDPCPNLLIDIDILAVVLHSDDQRISLGVFVQGILKSRLTLDKDVQ